MDRNSKPKEAFPMTYKTFFTFAFAVAMAFGLAGSASAIDCANPTPLQSISLTPPAGNFSGGTNPSLAFNFGGSLPGDCETWVRLDSSNFQAANPGFHNSFHGAGPHTMSFQAFAVNVTTPVTISATTKLGIGNNTLVGTTRTASMTLEPLPLISFNVDKASIQQNETATGRVELGGGTGGLDGLARVTLSSSNSAAVSIPAFVDVGNQTTPVSGGVTEYVKTFTISPRTVASATDVTITATRAGVTKTDTIRVFPLDCEVTVLLSNVDLPQNVPNGQNSKTDDMIKAVIRNSGTSQCPQTTLAMRMYDASSATGPFTILNGATTLEALTPNQQVEKGFLWVPVAGSGSKTFQLIPGANYPGVAAGNAALFLTLRSAAVDQAAAN